MDSALRIMDQRVVYNSGPAQLAGAAEVASDGSLVVAFNQRTDAIIGNVGQVHRSLDTGRTWEDTGTRLVCQTYEEGAVHVALGMACLQDGRLLLPYADVSSGRRTPQDHPRHMKGRPRRSVCRVLESTDNGATWTAPRTLQLPERLDWVYPYGKICQLEDGRILLPLHCQRLGPGDKPQDRAMRYFVSIDTGSSWTQVRRIASPGADALSETDMLVLPDGTWLAVSRQAGSEMLTTRSRDDGFTWEACGGTGIEGHSPSLLRASSGRLYVAYRKISSRDGKLHVREGGRAGLGISWSDDLGASWQGEMTLADPRGYTYQYGHETGMPCMLNLPDGRLAVVFYSYDPDLPYVPEDEVWQQVAHFYKRYIALSILEETV